MSVVVAAAINSSDWFNDGTGQVVIEQNQSSTQVTAVNNVDGTNGISISASQINQVNAQSPGLLPLDQIPGGPTIGSTVGTNAGTFGDGTAAVRWAFGNSSAPGSPYSGPVTLSGEFQLSYSAAWQQNSMAGFNQFRFASTATGIVVSLNNDLSLTATYPSEGSVITQTFVPSITASPNGGMVSFAANFHYSVLNLTPAAGESIVYTSTTVAQVTNLGDGIEGTNIHSWGVAQNSLSYSFSENAG